MALVTLAFTLPARSWNVPAPESALGFRVGDDRRLADWHEITAYFSGLDAASDRVHVEELGKSTEGLPFLLVTISSEANMARLEQIRRINAQLADPRGLSDATVADLLSRGRTIVALNHGIHSTEVASTQTAMEIAYELATSQAVDVREILDRCVILILPSENPDGTQKVTEWYRKTLGTRYEGGEIPFLYQKYVGHDNNRDWYMFTQQETRLTVRGVYERWHPQIVHDLHQMGARGPRFFAPPYLDPWEPNVDPALRAGVNTLGMHVAARLTSEGKRGVVVNALYDAWTPARAYPHSHGGVRILTESASARLASPIEVKFEDLGSGPGYDARRASWNFPAPWPGGTWRVRDIIDYQLSASRAVLDHAAGNRAFWLRTFLDVNRRACARQEPYAFIVPEPQKDPLAAAQLFSVLRTGGVEIHRARAGFDALGRRFEPGTRVVLMQQPASAFAKMLLETQSYPDLREYPGGPPRRPYDVTAHTLPLLLGVEVLKATDGFAAGLELEKDGAVTPGRVVGRGRFFALGHRTGDLAALGQLLAERVPVRWATEAFSDGGRSYPAGTLLVPESARGQLRSLAQSLGIFADGVDARPASVGLRMPRVGLYQSWVASMDEGWTRYVFDQQLNLPYTTLHDADLRAGLLYPRFDAIILPDQSPGQIYAGHAPGALPQEFTGGIGPEGVASLKEFVEAGGTLVAFNAATALLVHDLKLPVTNALERAAEGESFYCPGAILRVHREGESPLVAGLEDPSIVWFEDGPAFDVPAGTAALRYVEESPLLSGWLLGGRRLQGRAALAELPVGKGRVVLFGFRPQYRAQSWATYVPLLNALYTATTPRAPAAKM
jgi:hypothetical protein